MRRTRIRTWRGRCKRCGLVRSTHPQQVSRAGGAAGVQIGSNALALIADLNKRCGLSMRKTCDILQTHFGLSLSPGGLSQALDRIRDRLQFAYDQLIKALRASPAVHSGPQVRQPTRPVGGRAAPQPGSGPSPTR